VTATAAPSRGCQTPRFPVRLPPPPPTLCKTRNVNYLWLVGVRDGSRLLHHLSRKALSFNYFQLVGARDSWLVTDDQQGDPLRIITKMLYSQWSEAT